MMGEGRRGSRKSREEESERDSSRGFFYLSHTHIHSEPQRHRAPVCLPWRRGRFYNRLDMGACLSRFFLPLIRSFASLRFVMQSSSLRHCRYRSKNNRKLQKNVLVVFQCVRACVCVAVSVCVCVPVCRCVYGA